MRSRRKLKQVTTVSLFRCHGPQSAFSLPSGVLLCLFLYMMSRGFSCLYYFSHLRVIREAFTAAWYVELSVRPAWYLHPCLGAISVGLMLKFWKMVSLHWQQGRVTSVDTQGRVGPHQQSESPSQASPRDHQLARKEVPWPANSPGCRVPATVVNSPYFYFSLLSTNWPYLLPLSLFFACE